MRKQPNDVFNVCSGVTVSVNQIAQWVAEALGKEDIGLGHKPASELWSTYPEMFEGAYPLDKGLVAKETTRYSKGSYEKAERILGWRPHTNMESLVKKVTLEIE